jgi:hypothetical protein
MHSSLNVDDIKKKIEEYGHYSNQHMEHQEGKHFPCMSS